MIAAAACDDLIFLPLLTLLLLLLLSILLSIPYEFYSQ